MRKKFLCFLCILFLFLSGAGPVENKESKQIPKYVQEELIGSIRYFLNEANLDESSPSYGLVRDRAPGNPNLVSIAATGYGLAALPLAVENELLTYDEAEKRALLTLNTLWNMETIEGFYYHFINLNTGLRSPNSEISNIDTAIMLCGALQAGEYFGEEVKAKAKEIYDRVNWPWFVDSKKNMFYMSYRPEKGFAGHWDYYAEQLMLYILGAGSDTYPLDPKVYSGFTKNDAKYGKRDRFIHSWFGSIFTYQFTHAWVNFRNILDPMGIDWFKNSVDASLANYDFCKSLGEKYPAFAMGAWGLTACDSPNGYKGDFGSAPSGADSSAHKVDGTIPPAGALGSIVFTPEQALEAFQYYESIEGLKGDYGYKDAFNLEKEWIDRDYIGIDKGITMLMLQNYIDESVWTVTMKNEIIQKGLEVLGFKEKDSL